MTKQILSVHSVRQHVPEQKFRAGNFVWKCRNCAATLPDERNTPSPVLCPHCHEVMDWTPIRRK